MRTDFDTVKDDVMLYCIRLKVLQNKDVAAALLDSGDKTLIENSPTDYYWGCGKNGTGQNQLGKTLMLVRDELRDGTLNETDMNKKFGSDSQQSLDLGTGFF